VKLFQVRRGDLQLAGCSDDENLRLLGIELQAVLQVPQPDVSGAGGEEGKTVAGVVGVHGQL